MAEKSTQKLMTKENMIYFLEQVAARIIGNDTADSKYMSEDNMIYLLQGIVNRMAGD